MVSFGEEEDEVDERFGVEDEGEGKKNVDVCGVGMGRGGDE